MRVCTVDGFRHGDLLSKLQETVLAFDATVLLLSEIRQKHGSEAKTTTSPIKTGNKHTGKCNNHSDFLLLQTYSNRDHTAQMLVYKRMGVSHWKNAVSSTDKWFLSTVSLICNRIAAHCNIELQAEKVT